MSRDFDNSNPDFLRMPGTPAITAAPFTVSAWVRLPSISGNKAIWYIGNGGSSSNWWTLLVRGSGTVRFQVDDGSTTNVDSPTAYTANTWHHICAVEAAANDHRVFIDGGGKATSSISRTPSGVNRTTIGRLDDSSPINPFDGEIAHVALWNVAFTDEEVVSLANGVSPFRINRDSLKHYCPLNGQSPEPDVVAGGTFAITGSPDVTEEPPIPNSLIAA